MALVVRRIKRNKGDGLKQIWPSRFAKRKGANRNKGQEKARKFDGAPSEAENNLINCAQCNALLTDHTLFETCWFCGSDNFLGKPKWPLRR